MNNLLQLGIGMMGRPYVEAARRLGLTVHGVESEARIEAVVDLLDVVHPCRGDLEEQWAEAGALAASAANPCGVVAFSEPHVLAAALVQDSLGLPGPSLHASIASRNKALQRGLCATFGVRQPVYTVTTDLPATEDWAAGNLPVVIKPLSSAGSDGVELVATREEFRHAAQRRAGERVLVEEAVEGPEYSWEALVQDGKVWFANVTAKETTGPPQFVEVAHRVGVQLPPEDARAVTRLGESVLGALRMRTGLVHLEFRMTPSGPSLIEVAVRTPGDYLMDLLGLAYGIDWFEMVVRLATGKPLPPPPARPVSHAASYFVISEPGVVSATSGLDKVQAHPGVVHAGISVGPGDRVAAGSSMHRTGHAVVTAETAEGLEEALDFVRGALVVTTTPEG